MEIRACLPCDLQVLCEVWLASVRATHHFLGEHDIQRLLPGVQRYLAAPGHALWVLCEGAEPIGFMGLHGRSVQSLFIAPAHAGRGGGRRLLAHARALSPFPLIVDVNEQNTKALAFYIAAGFEAVGRSPVDEEGRPYPLVHLQEVAVVCDADHGEAPPGRPGEAPTVRAARRGDIGAIAQLAEEFAQWMRELGDDDALQLNAQALERDGFGAQPAFQGLVAEMNGEVVGYLLHHPGYDTDAACRLVFVIDLFVTPSARGLGCGAALMNAARGLARRAGARQLVWTVDRRNIGAMAFYAGLGAQPVETVALMSLDCFPQDGASSS